MGVNVRLLVIVMGVLLILSSLGSWYSSRERGIMQEELRKEREQRESEKLRRETDEILQRARRGF